MPKKKIDPTRYVAVVRPVRSGRTVMYEASIRELGNDATSYGKSPEAALAEAYETADIIMRAMVASGDALPEPEKQPDWEAFSGKFSIRVPKSLHYRLHILAERENSNVSQISKVLLAEGVTRRLESQRFDWESGSLCWLPLSDQGFSPLVEQGERLELIYGGAHA